MRGEVLHFDNEHGFGFVNGSDGKRYTFELSDLRREFAVSKGTLVEFQPDNDKARDIFLIRGEAGAVRGGGFGRSATVGEPVETGMFSYFWRGITQNYANFRDRARRKEFWGYALFYYLAWAVLVMVGLFLDQSLGFLDDEVPYATIAIGAIFFLATFVPFVALSVRRQHDIGLSGWFYLLILVPYVGSLILLVFALIPSQKHDNKWGAVPYGVRI